MVVPNMALIFNSLSYGNGAIDYTIQAQDASYASQVYIYDDMYDMEPAALMTHYMQTFGSAFSETLPPGAVRTAGADLASDGGNWQDHPAWPSIRDLC